MMITIQIFSGVRIHMRLSAFPRTFFTAATIRSLNAFCSEVSAPTIGQSWYNLLNAEQSSYIYLVIIDGSYSASAYFIRSGKNESTRRSSLSGEETENPKHSPEDGIASVFESMLQALAYVY